MERPGHISAKLRVRVLGRVFSKEVVGYDLNCDCWMKPKNCANTSVMFSERMSSLSA